LDAEKLWMVRLASFRFIESIDIGR